jgi:hypothetical protein
MARAQARFSYATVGDDFPFRNRGEAEVRGVELLA